MEVTEDRVACCQACKRAEEYWGANCLNLSAKENRFSLIIICLLIYTLPLVGYKQHNLRKRNCIQQRHIAWSCFKLVTRVKL